MTRATRISAGLALALILAGCRQDMHDQPKYEPLEKSDFFGDSRASRPLIEGTVARGWLREDDAYYRGLDTDGKFVASLPVELDVALLERGRERYDIFCSPCHGRTGDGQGMIVQRGFKHPESFHQDRLREIEIGYFFDVISNGFGQMSSYASMVPVADRWAIAAYVRTLQASRYADASELTADDRRTIDSPPADGSSHDDGTHGDEAEGH